MSMTDSFSICCIQREDSLEVGVVAKKIDVPVVLFTVEPLMEVF